MSARGLPAHRVAYGETDGDVHDYRVDVRVICEHANGSYLSVAARRDHCR